MHRPVHSCLDGDRDRSSLTAGEELELLELEETIALATARARETPAPDLRFAVMREIAAAPAPARAESILAVVKRLLWSPWQVTVRPAYLLGGAVAAAMLLAVAPVMPERDPAVPALASQVEPERLFVQFRLEAAGASNVALAGSFTGWEPSQELREVAPGTWVALIALEPGVHDYLFVVDGREWIADPVASPVDDGFGGTNSRLFLVAPGNRT